MEKQCLRKPEETLQETLLRATFQQHAPSTIDLEQGWEKIAPALRVPRKQVSFPQASLFSLANAFRQHQDEKRFLRHPRITVAAIAVLLVLIGIAVFPIANWLDGNQTAYAYAQVNQTQQDQGVNVTLLEAYASNSGTSLVTTIQIGNERGYMVVPHGILTYQQENLGISSGFVFVAHVNRPNLSCQLYSYSAAHPSADAHTVTLTWHVDQIIIDRSPLTSHNPGQTIHGNWTFQFTIPFHHDNSSPGTSTIDSTQC